MPLTQKQKQIRYTLRRIERGDYKHGTPYCYGALGCRLSECREAMREHQRKYEVSR